MRLLVDLAKVVIGVSLGLVSVNALANYDCKELEYGSDNYHKNMQQLIKDAGFSDGYFNRYQETVVSSICNGDEATIIDFVNSGYVSEGEVKRIRDNIIAISDMPAKTKDGIQGSLEYYDTDSSGNKVYFGNGKSGYYEVIFVDGSASVGRFSSASINLITSTGQAGYAVIPANSFEEMIQNNQFANNYEVDCDLKRVEDEEGNIMRLSDLSDFHNTSSIMACSVLGYE